MKTKKDKTKTAGVQPENVRKYAMGGFVLPLRRECPTIGAGRGTNVVDAKGRLVKHFNSITLADQFVVDQNTAGGKPELPIDWESCNIDQLQQLATDGTYMQKLIANRHLVGQEAK